MKKILVSFCTLFVIVYAFAGHFNEYEVYNKNTHHVIFAINWAPSPLKQSWIDSQQTFMAIHKMLKINLKDGKNEDRVLLSNNDYFSIVAFRSSVLRNTLQHFVKPLYTKSGKPYVAVCNDNNYIEDILKYRNNWKSLLESYPFDEQGKAFSLLTVAKPFCLQYFSKIDTMKLVNRTFLLMVSDRQFNGDMYNEINNLKNYNIESGITPINDNEVYPIYYAVNQSYFIKHIATQSIRFNAGSDPKGYVELFEYVPLQKNFHLSNVINYPNKIVAKRKRGGYYKCDFTVSYNNNPNYVPQLLELSFNENKIKITPNIFPNKEKDIHLTFKKDITSLKIKGWVLLHDGVYNATLLSPLPEAQQEAGRDGLVDKIEIEYEKEAQVFFIPLFDWMWWNIFPDDQYVAAFIWEGILVVILAILLLILFKYMQRYTPKKDNIRITLEESK